MTVTIPADDAAPVTVQVAVPQAVTFLPAGAADAPTVGVPVAVPDPEER